MANEQWADRFVHLTLAARPAPGAGFEARALAVMAAARPRRHPNLVTIIIVAALLLLLAAGVFAAVRYFFHAEGTLKFHEAVPAAFTDPTVADHLTVSAHLFSGELEWTTEPDPIVTMASRTPWKSPVADRVAFDRQEDWPPAVCHVFSANADGSDEVNLTQAAGLGGVNCATGWSPDGTKISFRHSEPGPGQLPCRAEFSIWSMNADGSDARRLTPEAMGDLWGSFWHNDASYLNCAEYYEPGPDEEPGVCGFGRRLRRFRFHIPSGGVEPLSKMWFAFSPDGLKAVTVMPGEVRAQLDGRPGAWQGLLLLDGGTARSIYAGRLNHIPAPGAEVLVEQFIADEDLEAHYPTKEQLEIAPDYDWHHKLRDTVGPRSPVWSPDGDKIAFLAALPWDPDGPYFEQQIEVWVYDLAADELIRLTDDDLMQHTLVWK